MRALILLALALPRIAHADDPPVPPPDELAKRIDDLEDQQRALAAEVRRNEATRAEVKRLLPLERFITVFVDVGAFAVGGNGSGIRSDLDHIYYPRYAGIVPGPWVFMGDPLSTAINSLGEPADTSDSREIKQDTVHSGGHPSLLVNSLGLAIRKDVGHDLEVWGLAELLPRPGADILDVELAYISYRPTGMDLEISAGKVNSVLGIEYRSQDAPRRVGVTPSLICRYTCGRTPGVEARYTHGALSLSGSLTNGDYFDKRFEPNTLLHANSLPTAAAHLQWSLDTEGKVEVGISGAVGPQTNQPDLDVAQWHYGLDLRISDWNGYDIYAEYVQGLEQGKTVTATPCDAAPCLRYKGAYVLVDRRVNPHFIPYVSVDWCVALHVSGVKFVY
jgi:hypothetical protein